MPSTVFVRLRNNSYGLGRGKPFAYCACAEGENPLRHFGFCAGAQWPCHQSSPGHGRDGVDACEGRLKLCTLPLYGPALVLPQTINNALLVEVVDLPIWFFPPTVL